MASNVYNLWKPLLAVLILITGCSKDPDQPQGTIDLISINTADPSQISQTSAVSGGSIQEEGTKTVKARGVCWSTTQNPTVNDSRTRDGSGAGTFQSELKNLSPGTTYYIRAYATNETSTLYGNEKEFTTPAIGLSKVSTASVTEITVNSATSGGAISDAGGGRITERGICWNTSSNPTVEHAKTSDGNGTGSFSSKLKELRPGTTYYVRAYAVNEAGVQYGNQQEFNTPVITLPVVSTGQVSGVNANSANVAGNVTATGGGTVSARGICWSTAANPTVNNSKSTEGSGPGTFSTRLSGLNAATIYYVRAYATNETGTSYGEQVQFTTESGKGGGGGNDDGGAFASVNITTSPVTKIDKKSAKSGGEVQTSSPFTFILERGVCWAQTQNPTINDSRTKDGNGTGSFNSELKGLDSKTTYYVRAYATTVVSTVYGNQLTFQTD